MASFAQHLTPVFGQSATHESYQLLKSLYEAHPTSRHVASLENVEESFPLFSYLKSLGITYTLSERDADNRLNLDSFTIYDYRSRAHAVIPRTFMGKATFKFEGTAFSVYKAEWQAGFCGTVVFFDLVFDTADDEPGKRLAAAVYAYAAKLKVASGKPLGAKTR